ncbi:MAG TPA: acyl-CoA desaturase [Acidimicrobiales bacterium]|nr:acyl-CoA desaturase [Acidimicrobiales bacterium]
MRTSTSSVPASDYRVLADRIAAAGLLDRRPAATVARMVLPAAAYGAGWLALVVIGDTWVSLGAAALLAFGFTQVDFVAHDAGHQQVFGTRRANGALGLITGNLLTGLSFGWWVPKHLAHHAHPNVVGRDPDIGTGAVGLSFTADIARSRHGAGRVLARRQAWVFFPLLMLAGAGLHISGVADLLFRRSRAAAGEGALLLVHAGLYLGAVFSVLSPLRGMVFVVVQQALFGLYLGCSFAPNHKGMTVFTDDSDLDLLSRQIVTARNLTGGPVTTFIFGGLDLQIEHHLFPMMPRCNLRKAQRTVRSFCAERHIAYHEDSIVGSYVETLRYLERIGAA